MKKSKPGVLKSHIDMLCTCMFGRENGRETRGRGGGNTGRTGGKRRERMCAYVLVCAVCVRMCFDSMCAYVLVCACTRVKLSKGVIQKSRC